MEMNASVFMAIGCIIGMIGFISWGIVKNFEENLLTNSGGHTKEEIDNTEKNLDSSLQEEEIDDLIAEGEQVAVEEDQTIEDLNNEINTLLQAQEEEKAPVEEDQTIEDLNNEINAWRQMPPVIDGWNVPAIEVEEAPAKDSHRY